MSVAKPYVRMQCLVMRETYVQQRCEGVPVTPADKLGSILSAIALSGWGKPEWLCRDKSRWHTHTHLSCLASGLVRQMSKYSCAGACAVFTVDLLIVIVAY